MRRLYPAILALLLTSLAAPVSQAGQKRPQPENWPTSPYPAGKPDPGGGEGCRMPMRELLQKYERKELAIKTNIEDANAHWGSYTVGDDVNFGAAIGPPNSRIFGSVKHGSDGGDLIVTCYWMDESGKKVLGKSVKAITAGC